MDIVNGETNGKQLKCGRCERTVFLKSLGKSITNFDTYEYPTGWLLERDGINDNKIYGDSTSTYSFHWICPRCAIQQGFKAELQAPPEEYNSLDTVNQIKEQLVNSLTDYLKSIESTEGMN